MLQDGAGLDTLIGGEGGDRLYDFVSGEDMTEVSAGAFGGGLLAGEPLAGHFTTNTTGRASSAAGTGQFVYQTDGDRLWWDADGAGGEAGTLLASLVSKPAFTASDIHVIG